MLKMQQGFTLIELIVTVAILGILAAVALPQFFSVTPDARQNATNSVAAALSAANAENYSVRSEKSTNGQAVANCTDVANILVSGLPSGYTITSGSTTLNAITTCTVNGTGGTTASFNATGIN